jgi:hypothetical protein
MIILEIADDRYFSLEKARHWRLSWSGDASFY